MIASIDSDAKTDAVTEQVRRILSLDHPGREWLAAGERDPVIGRLQRAHPGLRPVLFHSPYEAAAWSVISARRQRAQAATLRTRIAREHGRTFTLAGEQAQAFPLPERLLALDAIGGIDAVRLQRLHGVARAALDGALEPLCRPFLRSRPGRRHARSAKEHLRRLAPFPDLDHRLDPGGRRPAGAAVRPAGAARRAAMISRRARSRHCEHGGDHRYRKEGNSMANWRREIGAMTLYVPDLGQAQKFYADVFGLEAQPMDDATVMVRFESVLVFLHRSSAAAQPLPDILEEARNGAGQFAIIVEDVDAVCAEIAERGVVPITGPADREWGMRTATFADPGGNVWEIAQEIASGDG